MYPLVSIITPCYNGESYVHRLLDSVLAQSYPNIELIFVNDGSTDDTERIVLSYQKRIEDKGYSFIYISQDNAGQAAAVNRGLKVFSGDYLTWPDSDDWMTPDSIEKRVEFLEENKEVGILFSGSYIVNENDIGNVVDVKQRMDIEGSFFDFLINNRNVFWSPISYMVRSSMFLDALPSKSIYAGHSGQNIQMLLPIAYYFPLAQIDLLLGYYFERDSSHSHKKCSEKEIYYQAIDREVTLLNTISNINMTVEEKNRFLIFIRDQYAQKRFNLAFNTDNRTIIKREYKNLKKNSKVSRGARNAYYEKCHRDRLLIIEVIKKLFHKDI